MFFATPEFVKWHHEKLIQQAQAEMSLRRAGAYGPPIYDRFFLGTGNTLIAFGVKLKNLSHNQKGNYHAIPT